MKLLARIDEARNRLNLSRRGVSIKAAGNPDVVRNLARGTVKTLGSDQLIALANALEVSEAWLLHGNENSADNQPTPTPTPTAPEPHPKAHSQAPRDVPIYGCASGSIVGKVEGFDMLAEPVDKVTRPPALQSAKGLYAIFVIGDSMAPKHEAGDLRFVHPHKPPQPGQSVIVQTKAWAEDPGQAYIKTFEKRTQDKIILRQINPNATIEIPAQYVTALHRVLTTAELFGV